MLSLRDLASAADVALATVVSVEKGSNPRGVYPSTARRLSKALFVPPKEIMVKGE